MDEAVHGTVQGIYCWQGPKMGMTLFSAKLGSLSVTDRRVLFLSTGKSDVGRKMARAAVSPSFGLDSAATSSLDLTALTNPGSFEAPLDSIIACEAGKKKALILKHRNDSGEEVAHALGGQYGMPALDDWVELINSLRS